MDKMGEFKKLTPPNPSVACEKAFVRYEPLGIALVFGSWNFPFALHVKPLVQAIS